MNRRLLIFSAFLLLAATNCSWAWQLSYNYYNSWNVSVGTGGEMLASVNTSGPVRLMVLSQSELYNYSNGYHYKAAYNATVNTGVYAIKLSPGEYTAIIDAAFKAVTITDYVTVAQSSKVRQVNINGVYQYPLALSNYSSVNITIISTVPVNMNMTNTYYNRAFNNYYYGSNWDIHLNRGSYILNFSSATQTQAFIVMNSTPTLITPIPYWKYSSAAFPVGVASYGLNNYTGFPQPYVVKTNLVEGGANITSIYAYNASPPSGVSQYGAGLQLNVIMDVISGSQTYTYWLQDVLGLNTSNQTYGIENNVWNFSSPNATLSDGTLTGSGQVHETKATWANSSAYVKYYAVALPESRYSFPLYFYPVIFARVRNGNPVVSFGYYTATGIYYYDNVTFSIPASDAYILVTPFYKSQKGVPYDAEFVFGGQNSGEITSFNRMNASLYLYYNSSGTVSSFPAVYSFGSETAEAVTNLQTSGSPHGVHVFVGPLNLTSSYIYTLPNQVVNTTSTTTTISPQTTQSTIIFNNTSTMQSTTINYTTIPETSLTTIAGKNGSNTSTIGQIIGAVIGLAILIGIFYAAYRILKFVLGALRGKAPAPTDKKQLKKK